MYSCKVLRGVLLPAAALIAEDRLQQNSQNTPPKCRPSELPIYVPDPPPIVKEPSPEPSLPNFLEENVSAVRQQFTKIYSEIKAYQKVGFDYLEQSRDNAEWLFKYLREEDNTTPKAGAIAIGGLTGLIFGLRGGFFKRTIYATTGALGMASICYPKEASEYSQIGIAEAKKYATIAYNFAYGVKKDDPPLELPSLPKLPTSLTDAWDSVTKSASSFVSGKEVETEQQVIETHSVDITESDALTIVAKAHDQSSQSCHCPVGACLGQHNENIPASN